jgi:hypothetical protein
MRNRTDRTAGGWRQYQRHLQRNRVARRFRGRLAGALLLGAAGVLAAAGLWSLIGGPSAGPGKAAAPVQERPDAWARADLKEAISAADLFNLREPGFEVGFGQRPHHVETSLSRRFSRS